MIQSIVWMMFVIVTGITFIDWACSKTMRDSFNWYQAMFASLCLGVLGAGIAFIAIYPVFLWWQ